MGLKFHSVVIGDAFAVVVFDDDRRAGQFNLSEEGFRNWQGVMDGSWQLKERLALQTARRLLSEIAAHAKIGDDGYHDAVIDLARAWKECYG